MAAIIPMLWRRWFSLCNGSSLFSKLSPLTYYEADWECGIDHILSITEKQKRYIPVNITPSVFIHFSTLAFKLSFVDCSLLTGCVVPFYFIIMLLLCLSARHSRLHLASAGIHNIDLGDQCIMTKKRKTGKENVFGSVVKSVVSWNKISRILNWSNNVQTITWRFVFKF